ncbi:tape measure protein [Labedaea rhizosphaerae]|uniref:Tape measure domain-containing protein n=1 Tax=Labedaea rhizosphaerae TaxID=598644 RepID=A0A4V3CZW1_LABRH|nr:tape measure protein [Labedaea rhizosphaerae]TDQ01241.1 tape measure domain-containing protein [Labedaea rhizosphaerae]
MPYTVGTAVLQVVPSLRGIGASVNSQLGTELRGVGERTGRDVGARLGGGVTTGLLPALDRARTAFTDTAKAGAGEMSTLARGTAPVLDQLAKVSPVLGRVRDGFGSAQIAGMALSGTAGTVGGRLRTVAEQTSRVGSGFTAMASVSRPALTRVGSTIESAISAPLRGATTVLAGYGITAGTAFTVAGVAAVGMGIKFAASQEQAVTAFTTMLHSGQDARQFMVQLQDFAAKTPFDLPSVVTGAQRLMAFGFDAKQVLPTLTAIGDAVAGMGGSAEQINQVTLAIGQMSAKGKVQGDEILQLTEAGIPALRILANQMGVSTAKLQDMISKGLVPSSKAIPLLLTGIERGTKGAAGQTQAFAGMMANQATTLTGVWSNFTDNLNRSLGRLVAPAMPAIKTALTWLTTELGQLPAVMTAVAHNPLVVLVTGALRTAVGEVAGGFRAMFTAFRSGERDVTSSGLAGFFEQIGIAARIVYDALRPVVVLFGQIAGAAIVVGWRLLGSILHDYVGPAIVTIATWLHPLTPVVVGLAAAFGTWLVIATTVGAVTKAFKLLQTAILLVRGAWLLLSAAFIVSPIGVIITLLAGLVAGVIYAWTHFAGFRQVVEACWHGIQVAAAFAWNSVLKPTLVALGSAAQAVGSAFVAAWHGIVVAVQAVGAAASWLWFTVLAPVFKVLYTAAAILFGIVVTAVLTPIVLALKLVGAVALWLWDHAIHPAFAAIGAFALWLWTIAIRPVIAGIVAYFRMWAQVGIWLWHNAIQPALAGIAWLFTWLWTTMVKPVIDAIVFGVQALGSAAVSVWQNAIVPAWHGIGAAVSVVWRSVVQPVLSALRVAVSAVGAAFAWVYANVIRPAWAGMGNAVRAVYDHVLHPAFEAVKTAVRAVGSAFGAVVDGIKIAWNKIKGYAAAPINFVIQTIWNNGIRKVWNAITGWIPGVDLTLGELAPVKFAAGGVLAGYAPGRDTVPAILSPGEAVLVPELVRLLGPANIVAANAAARGGRGGTGTGPTMTGSVPHFFLGGLWDGITSVAGGIVHAVENVAGGIADAASFIAHFTTDPLGTLTSMIPGLDGLKRWASAGWGKAIVQLPGSVIGGLISTIKRALGLEDDHRGGPAPQPPVAAGVQHWTGLVQQVLALLGQPLSLVPNVMRRMNQESGGNPRAINLTDINAQHGTPSIGLMQVIKPTFDRWCNPALSPDIYDPLANIYAGLNYALHRYPSLQYAMDKPGGYDSGGWLPPGLSTVYNGTRTPEAVLTARQWDAVERSIGSTGGSFTGTLVLNSGQFLGVVRGEINQASDALGDAIATRTRI